MIEFAKQVSESSKIIETETEHNSVLEGRRIDLKTISEQLFCRKCHATLSLLDAVDEKRHGLFSIFTVKCQVSNQVATDTKHLFQKNNKNFRQVSHYDVNSRAALGTVNAGNTHLNKVLASLNIPPFHSNTHKTHEEVGFIINEMSKESCMKAAQLEREMTINNVDKLKTLL